jgi:hypothetical protein
MENKLNAFYHTDPGFAQFVDCHALVSSKHEIRNQYAIWKFNQILEAENLAAIKAEGEAKGEAKGIAKGKAERNMEIALIAFRNMASDECFPEAIKILRSFGISEKVIESAHRQIVAERNLNR